MEVAFPIQGNVRMLRIVRVRGAWIVWTTPHNPEGYGTWIELHDDGTMRRITHLPDELIVRDYEEEEGGSYAE